MPTVFVVEGQHAGLKSLTHVVRNSGVHTLPMANAEVALNVLCAIRADLLLVNLTQADAAGQRLVEQVRRIEALAEMPIIAIQARGRKGGSAEATSASLRRHIGIGSVLIEGEYTQADLIEEIRKYVPSPAPTYQLDVAAEWQN